MTGLILKDLMVLKKALIIYAIMGAVYGYLAITQEQMALMFAMLLIVSAMVPVSSVSYDERCKWDKLANTAPISRSGIVLSKYLLALILTAVSAVFIFAIYLFDTSMPLAEKLALTVIMSLVAMFYQAVLLPIIIKFGSEKGRMFMMIALFVPVIAIMSVVKLVPGLAGMLDRFVIRNEHLLPFIMTGGVLIVYALSIILSVNIYKNKDL